jgi:transposase
MERHFSDRIEVYPQHVKEVQFSEIEDSQLDKFSTADVIPWSSGDFRLRKTIVFVERFFNKVSCKELAERFDVKENTIVCMYAQALEHVERIIEALDARREGLKAIKADRFTEEQKYFLLTSVFGFSQAEVARMFKRNRDKVNTTVKHMADRFEALFSGQEPKKESTIDDPPIKDKLTRADVISIVDAYVDQGLSHRQAFKRIAGRYAEVVGRSVSVRGIESRYYKATAPKEKPVVKSAYEGKTKEEIIKMMTG